MIAILIMILTIAVINMCDNAKYYAQNLNANDKRARPKHINSWIQK